MIATIISNPKGSVRCEVAAACGPEGLVAVALASGGSVDNAEQIGQGTADSGLVQANIASNAYHGAGAFKGKAQKDLRVIARLYPEAVHLAASKKSGIKSIRDLRGKRVSLDARSAGTAPIAAEILAAEKVDRKSMKIIEASPERSAKMLKEGTLDAFFFVGGAPVDAIADLAEDGLVILVPIKGRAMERLTKAEPFFQPMTIAKGTYPGIVDIETLAVGALWVVNASADETLVYRLTSALFEPTNRPFLERGHPQGRAITRAGAIEGIDIPLHPGAERYYREKGVLPAAPVGNN
jgi:hypothetical protein